MGEDKIIKVVAENKKTGEKYERIINREKMIEGAKLARESHKLQEKKDSLVQK